MTVRDKLLDIASKEGVLIGGRKHAAGIVHRGKLIAVGWNKRKSHPVMMEYPYREGQIYLHAETDAILKASRTMGTQDLSACSIYVVSLTKGGRVGNSRPCNGCWSMIHAHEIREVWFS